MRVFVMTDLEGVCGVLDSTNWCLPSSRYYGCGKELLTLEVNAAIDGFVAGGASEIMVADGHGSGAIIPALLHSSAELARNWPQGHSYPFSLDSRSFDLVASIGQHPKAGTVGGHLCHTGSMVVRDQTINRVSVGEFGELVFSAWELGCRMIFATGCEAFTREADELVPEIETVAVKRGMQTDPGHNLPATRYREHNIAAIHLSVIEARDRIRAGAQRAIERAGEDPAYGQGSFPAPYERIKVLRSSDNEPPRVQRDSHGESVIGLLNQSPPCVPIDYDPLDLINL